jgi:hypothetical protein
MSSTASPSPVSTRISPESPGPKAWRGPIKFFIPVVLLVLVGTVLASVLMAAPRTPPALLGASATVDGGLARIQGVIPTEVDGWAPPPSVVLADPVSDGAHRVRILLELTAMEEDGLSFDPSRYAVSALGDGTWEPVWFSPAPATARQGQTIDAVLVFELPDRAIDLTLELPGGPGLSLGEGHHRG